VRRLHLLSGREFHPLEAPGLSWRTIVQIHVTQQYADRTTLWGAFLIRTKFPIFQNACFQPASDQADQTRVPYPMLNKAEHPIVAQAPEAARGPRRHHRSCRPRWNNRSNLYKSGRRRNPSRKDDRARETTALGPRKQLVEHVTGRLGERRAHSQNLLVRLGGIEQDCFIGHAGEGLPFDRRLRGESRSARSQADIDFALGGSGYAKGVCPRLKATTPAALTFRKSRRACDTATFLSTKDRTV
jgi:hypothetical protein